MYFIKTPWYVKAIYPSLIWDISTKTKSVYLTFDDGPVPGVTDLILDMLKSYQASATFFCIGENVQRHPKIFDRILLDGHTIGNHTYHHLNGWKTADEKYFENVEACNLLINTPLFRPPYGRIGIKQIQHLRSQYAIYMWDVLSGDFDSDQTPESCAANVIRNAEVGSIVVFHDSEKARRNVLGALPKVLEYCAENGFAFKSLPKNRDAVN